MGDASSPWVYCQNIDFLNADCQSHPFAELCKVKIKNEQSNLNIFRRCQTRLNQVCITVRHSTRLQGNLEKWAGKERKNLANDPCVLVPCPNLEGQEVPLGPSCGVFTAPRWTLEASAPSHFLFVEGSEERLRYDLSGERFRSPWGLTHPLWLINFSKPAGAGPSLKRAVIAALFRPQSPCYQESWGLIATLIKRLFKNLWLAMNRTWRVIANKYISHLLETPLLMRF